MQFTTEDCTYATGSTRTEDTPDTTTESTATTTNEERSGALSSMDYSAG